MTVVKKKTCVKMIMPDGWHQQACGVRASIMLDGKWYCRRHDPVKQASERERKEALYRTKETEDNARDAVERLEQRLVRFVCESAADDKWDLPKLGELADDINRAHARLDAATVKRHTLERK